MNFESNLHDKLSLRIWKNYFARVNRILRRVTIEQRDEIVLELQGHIFESVMNEQGDSEPEKVMNAIEKLGEPEDFLKPIVAERLLANATKNFSLAALVRGLYYNLYSGVWSFLLSMVFAAGYMVILVFLSASVMKLFIPDFGMYVHNDGGFTIGIVSEYGRQTSREILGLWLVPVGVAISVGLYVAMTKLLGILAKTKE